MRIKYNIYRRKFTKVVKGFEQTQALTLHEAEQNFNAGEADEFDDKTTYIRHKITVDKAVNL